MNDHERVVIRARSVAMNDHAPVFRALPCVVEDFKMQKEQAK